jgi:hypothetical protein
VDEDEPHWDAAGRIYFRAAEGKSNFVYRMNGDGSKRVKITRDPILDLSDVSPDGRWVVVAQGIGESAGVAIVASPVDGGRAVTICRGCVAQWNPGGNIFSVVVDLMDGTKTVQVPVLPGRNLPTFPPAGILTKADMQSIKGASVLDGAIIAGPTRGLSARVQYNVHRNLYRVRLN